MTILLIILIALGAIWLNSSSSFRFYFGIPDYVAVERLDTDGSTVSVALNVSSPIGKAEFYRQVTVRNAKGHSISYDLEHDHGGFPSVSLYRREDDRLVIASSLDGMLLVDSAMPSIVKYNDRPKSRLVQSDVCARFTPKETGREMNGLKESMYLSNLFYIGRFDFRKDRSWKFVPASQEREYLRSTGVGDFWNPGCR